jgi:hypothetical protein
MLIAALLPWGDRDTRLIIPNGQVLSTHNGRVEYNYQGINIGALRLAPGQTIVKKYRLTNGPVVNLTIHRLTLFEVTVYNKTAVIKLTNPDKSYSITNEDSWGRRWLSTKTFYDYNGTEVTSVSQHVIKFGCTWPYSIAKNPSTTTSGINTKNAHAFTICVFKQLGVYTFSLSTESCMNGNGFYSGAVSSGESGVWNL